MIGAAMQAPLAAVTLVLELTHSGFGLMVPMIAATVTAIAYYIDGYSIYSARLPARPDAKPHDLPPDADGDGDGHERPSS
jgi:chloride channel protein, CIC family